MKNAAIVKAYPNRKALRAEHEALKRQIKKLIKQEEQLRRECDLVDRVTEIFEGIALTVDEKDYQYGKHLDVHAVSYDIGRWADVYPNAHNGGQDWGIHMRYGGATTDRREAWSSCGWPYAEACAAARRFVAHGDEPNKAWEDMIKMRHMLDPKGTATKRRRDAFEAAYTAGHSALAGELLLGGVDKLEVRMRVIEAQNAKAKENEGARL